MFIGLREGPGRASSHFTGLRTNKNNVGRESSQPTNDTIPEDGMRVTADCK